MEHTALSLLWIIPVCLGALFAVAALITGFMITRKPSSEKEFDYLVVLGTTVHGSEPSVLLRDRIHAAYSYLCDHDAICIVSGGKADAGTLSEAQCMYNQLTVMGIAPDRIWEEDKSVSTAENLRFSLALIEKQTGRSPGCIGVVSSDFHMYRVRMLADKVGIHICPISARSTRNARFCLFFLREILAVWYNSIIPVSSKKGA